MDNHPQMLAFAISQKESELKEMQDVRIARLEAFIADRDELLHESAKRFKQLQDDFKFNLGIIDARDIVIKSLEAKLKEVTERLEVSSSDTNTLLLKLESLENAHADRERAWLEKEEAHKNLKMEIRSVSEQMNWAYEEEKRVLRVEIESLKSQLDRSVTIREEAIERQRRELVESFERLQKDRERDFYKQEEAIAVQIERLTERMELQQTESVQLKSSLAEALRAREKLQAELAAIEESHRQTQYQLRDERDSKATGEDSLQRSLQNTQVELSVVREQHAKELLELRQNNDKLTSDLKREKDFRAVAERRIEEAKIVFAHDKATLQAELVAYRANEEGWQNEAATLREERDASLNRGASLRLEIEAVEVRAKAVQREADALRAELAAERERSVQSENKYRDLNEEFQRYREDVKAAEYRIREHAAEQVLQNKNVSFEEVRVLSESHDAELRELRARHGEEIARRSREWEARIEEAQSKALAKAAEADRLLMQLEEEQRSARAVEARMGVKEETIARLTRDTKALRGALESYKHRWDTAQHEGGIASAPPTFDFNNSAVDLNLSGDMSAFSAEIPSFSLPNSPDPRGYAFGAGAGGGGGGGAGSLANSLRASAAGANALSSRALEDLRNTYHAKVIELTEATAARDRLAAENEELKGAIKEARGILDDLHQELSDKEAQHAAESKQAAFELREAEAKVDQLVRELHRVNALSAKYLELSNTANAKLRDMERATGGHSSSSTPTTPTRHMPPPSSLFDLVTSQPPPPPPGSILAAPSPYANYPNFSMGATPMAYSQQYHHPHSPTYTAAAGPTPHYQGFPPAPPSAAAAGHYPYPHSLYTGGPSISAPSSATAAAAAAGFGTPLSPTPRDHLRVVQQHNKKWEPLYSATNAAAAAAAVSAASAAAPSGSGSAAASRGASAPARAASISNGGGGGVAPVPSNPWDANLSEVSAKRASVGPKSDVTITIPESPAAAAIEAASPIPALNRRHTIAAARPPPSITAREEKKVVSAAAKLFGGAESDREGDSGDLAAALGLSVRPFSASAASSTGAAEPAGASGVRRASLSLSARSGLPVPISNSDRMTSSQTKSLTSLKQRRASTGTATAPRNWAGMKSEDH